MSLTIVYTVRGREFRHTGSGESLTRFLSSLNADGIKWRYDDSQNVGCNLFAGLKLAS